MFFSFGLILLAIAGFAQKPAISYTLTGTIVGKNDGYIYLDIVDMDRTSRTTDSAQIKNGTFVFRGTLKEPTFAAISDGNLMSMNNPNVVTICLDNRDMTISLIWGDFKNYKLTGSQMNDEMLSYENVVKPLSIQMEELGGKLHAEKDSAKASKIEAQIEPLRKQYEDLTFGYIKSHPDSYASSHLLSMEMSNINMNQAEEYYNLLSERVKTGSSAASVLKQINILKGIAPGSVAPEFSSTDINGKKLALSDFRGKYVIVDFWASWCVPCRQSNPHLKELYAKYHDKGLEVICISDDDSNPGKWRAAVEKDGIQMFHHILRGFKVLPGMMFDRTNDISDKYAVHSIPTKFLIDKEGKIVGKFEAEELTNKLREIFGL